MRRHGRGGAAEEVALVRLAMHANARGLLNRRRARAASTM